MLVNVASLQRARNVASVTRNVEQNCSALVQWNITLNVTIERVIKRHFHLYQKVINLKEKENAQKYIFLDMSLAESPALDAALESEMDGFDSSSILHLLLLQDSENQPLTWCCYIAHHANLTSTADQLLVPSTHYNCCSEVLFESNPQSEAEEEENSCSLESMSAVQEFTEWRQATVRQARIIVEVIISLGWDNILVLYETHFELQVRLLVDLASSADVRVSLGNVDSEDFVNIMLEHFEKMPDFNAVLVSSLVTAQQILQLAQGLEPQNGKSISVTGLSKWLLFCQEGVVHADTWMFSSIFDNVALISDSRLLGPDHQIQMNSDDLFVLTTLLYKTGRRELAAVGSVLQNWTLHLQQDVFPNIKFGFNERLFVITTTPWKPYVYRHKDENGTVSFTGFCIDMAEELSRTLNFTIRYTEPPDGHWGNDDGNGTWNGMVGQVVRQEVDMIVAPIGITEARDGVIDFTSPFFYDDSAVIFKKPDPNKSKWRTYIDIFRIEVLLCAFVALLGSCMIIYLLTRGEVRVYGNNRRLFASSYIGCILYMFGSMLAQGGRNLPYSLAGRLFLSSWWLFCLIMAGTYSGNLIAVLTVTKDKPPFETLKEMASQDDYRFGTLGNSMWSELFKTSPRPEFQAIHTKMKYFYRDDPDIYNSNTELHLQKVKRGGYAYIADKGLFSLWLATNCDLILLKEKFFPGKYGIGLPNNSVYTKIFSDQVVKLYESGLLQVWVKKWWPPQTICRGALVTQAKTLSLLDMQSSFYVLAIGVALSAIVLGLEAAFKYLRHLRQRVKWLHHEAQTTQITGAGERKQVQTEMP
ncbi:hypothetical protein RRG08_026064 [Elysia crispata]|uniref:Uncharacterized protein n=1 Tax=Elysia crispata TaxID=231223 RepID=A0AAE0YR15_9GAST|nr:hypothetical protein RRG08_026064 [Elysia crispata]